ncbi:reverse transcriptase [Lasius niger]|uniref:Reverse transcriptase n=1 Tax=Lasius niger TaxID=67767 RepID=A0A0J7K6I9_LASNI|nr:reverse transcriptase [Lasius niger]
MWHVARPESGITALDSPQWYTSKNERAAWLSRQDGIHGRCSLITRGEYSVAMRYKDLHLISCYISPNLRISKYLEALDELEDIIRASNRKRIIICGDFNAKSPLWGSRILDRRGSYLEDWAAGNGLWVANVGNTPTCVRPQGRSIPDITWATPEALTLIEDWRVDTEHETLSDHRYIEFNVNLGRGRPSKPTRRIEPYPRWNLKKLDVNMLHMALEWACAVGRTETKQISLSDRQRWLRRIMRESCDSAAPRHRSGARRKQAYWWSEKIAASRKDCIRQKRLWNRSAKGQDEEIRQRRKRNYKRARKDLRRQIKAAKAKAWQELIEDVNRDPWGLPYLIVLKKLRRSSLGLTEKMDEEKLNELLDSLFPRGVEHDPSADWVNSEWNEE